MPYYRIGQYALHQRNCCSDHRLVQQGACSCDRSGFERGFLGSDQALSQVRQESATVEVFRKCRFEYSLEVEQIALLLVQAGQFRNAPFQLFLQSARQGLFAL